MYDERLVGFGAVGGGIGGGGRGGDRGFLGGGPSLEVGIGGPTYGDGAAGTTRALISVPHLGDRDRAPDPPPRPPLRAPPARRERAREPLRNINGPLELTHTHTHATIIGHHETT